MRSLIFFLFLSISFDLLASSLVDEEFINEQDFLLRVRLVESRELSYIYQFNDIACGKNHKAKIIKSYGGEISGYLEFSSTIPLTVGLDYFLFLNDKTLAHRAMNKRFKRIHYSDEDEATSLTSCFSKLEEKHVDYSNIFVIDLYPALGVDGDWMKVYEKLYIFPDSVKVIDGWVDSDGEYRAVEWSSFKELLNNETPQ